MDFKDYYKILGVDPSASGDEIKRTYKKLARKYHPDVSEEENAQQKFQEVSEAYEVLKNPGKRAEYDELREYVNNPRSQGGGQGGFRFEGGDFNANAQFEDLLRSIFGERGFDGQAGAGSGNFGFEPHGFNARGRDLHHQLKVTLEEAYAGGERNLRLSTMNGEKTIRVKIPKGIQSGKELRLRGQGEPGHGGANGDLFLEIRIEPHSLYQVDGKDISLVLPVSPWEAALGASVPVPTLGGKVNLKVPPNSQNGRKLRLGGRGLDGGDQIVTLKIVNPEVTNDASREAFEQLRDQFDFDPRRSMTGASR